MRASLRLRPFAVRLMALSATAGAAVLVGLGATAADAAPTTSAATVATTATAATTTPTTTTPTTTTTTATPTPTTSVPGKKAAGPQCPGAPSVLTPVVCIPADSGEDKPAPVGTDGMLGFVAQVVNNGPAVSDATVVIALPKGLRLESDEDDPVNRYEDWWSDDSDGDGTALDCTPTNGGASVSCATGPVPAGANFLVGFDLVAQDDAVANTSGKIKVTLHSAPLAGTFPTTSIQATVDFVGTAHLQVHLTPAKATVTVGHSLTLTATVHNVGPNRAVEAAGVGFVLADGSSDDETFLITNSTPFPDDPGSANDFGSAFLLQPLASFKTATASARTASATTASATTVSARMASARTALARTASATTASATTASATSSATTAKTGAPTPFGFWPIGTIAPGATATVTIVVKAVLAGHSELDFDATSADESCDVSDDPSCENTASADLDAVAAVATTTTATPTTTAPTTTSASPTSSAAVASAVSTSAGSAAALPNTGFQPAPWLTSAGAAILLGIGLMLIGAPRRRASGRHR